MQYYGWYLWRMLRTQHHLCVRILLPVLSCPVLSCPVLSCSVSLSYPASLLLLLFLLRYYLFLFLAITRILTIPLPLLSFSSLLLFTLPPIMLSYSYACRYKGAQGHSNSYCKEVDISGLIKRHNVSDAQEYEELLATNKACANNCTCPPVLPCSCSCSCSCSCFATISLSSLSSSLFLFLAITRILTISPSLYSLFYPYPYAYIYTYTYTYTYTGTAVSSPAALTYKL